MNWRYGIHPNNYAIDNAQPTGLTPVGVTSVI